jgi:ABC-2 type transport system ATP-binding protein
MKQRLQIARGLINNPDYIFMDEPTLGLDSLIAKELRQHVKKIACEDGKGILLTSHYMAEIEELCDYVYVLNKGEVIEQGTPKELATMGLKNKTIYLKVEKSGEFTYEKLCQVCRNEDNSAVIKENASENIFTITATLDLKLALSKFCMKSKSPIIKLYEEEPKLEDAIIRFAKEA